MVFRIADIHDIQDLDFLASFAPRARPKRTLTHESPHQLQVFSCHLLFPVLGDGNQPSVGSNNFISHERNLLMILQEFSLHTHDILFLQHHCQCRSRLATSARVVQRERAARRAVVAHDTRLSLRAARRREGVDWWCQCFGT